MAFMVLGKENYVVLRFFNMNKISSFDLPFNYDIFSVNTLIDFVILLKFLVILPLKS